MKTILMAILSIGMVLAKAQSLTLSECYSLAEQNYPLIKQYELISKTREYSLENLSKGYLPQVSINGQATYQSAVTRIPIQVPGIETPTLSKDQYKIYGEVNQSVYDGGVLREQKQVQEISALVEKQKIEVEMYKLKERINQLYFGLLIVGEQTKQNDLLRKDIELGLRKTEGAISNGAAFRSNADVLKAELLKIGQRRTELDAMRTAYLDMLGLFINQALNDKIILVKPKSLSVSDEISRPELTLYNYQHLSMETQQRLLSARNRPRVNLFVQGGYGRPALNMLSNNFEAYYIGGIKLNWTLSGLYTVKKEKAILDLNKQAIEVQRNTFVFNTSFAMKQQRADINKYNQLLSTDDDIIALRSGIKTTASVQLENGVITTSDYLREVNAEDQARQNKIVHEIQLLLTEYTRQTTSGNVN